MAAIVGGRVFPGDTPHTSHVRELSFNGVVSASLNQITAYTYAKYNPALGTKVDH